MALYLFFMANKRGPLGEISPFADDPYDAVGSFAFQLALLVGALSYGRALRLREDPGLAPSSGALARLILRGDLLVLFAILATLLADTLAAIPNPQGLRDPSGFVLGTGPAGRAGGDVAAGAGLRGSDCWRSSPGWTCPTRRLT